MLSFSATRVGEIRQKPLQSHATLLLPSSVRLQAASRQDLRRVVGVRRVYLSTGEHELERGSPRDVLAWIDKHLDDSIDSLIRAEPIDLLLTIIAVERLEVFAAQGDRAPTLQIARACGYRTVEALRDAWTTIHPRSPLAHLVWFMVGDLRDRPRFLTSTRSMRWGPGKKGGSPLGDYTSSRSKSIDDAEALTRAEMSALVGWNRQKDEARRAKASATLASETPSQRLLRIERYIETIRTTLGEEAARTAQATVRQELWIVERRLARAENRKIP